MTTICARCGQHFQMAAHVSSCPFCGNVSTMGYGPPAAMMVYGVPPMMMRAPKCSRATYIVLGLFLGCLGIHNFVAGRTASAVIQLLITLLLGWLIVPLVAVALWAFIELIAVDSDGDGVRMN